VRQREQPARPEPEQALRQARRAEGTRAAQPVEPELEQPAVSRLAAWLERLTG
jgi:hypothetical protein